MFEYICERFLIYAANILGGRGGGVTATEQTVSHCMTTVNEGPNYRILIVYQERQRTCTWTMDYHAVSYERQVIVG